MKIVFILEGSLVILCIFTQQLYVAIIWCSATALTIFAHSTTFNSNYTLKEQNYVLEVCIKIKVFVFLNLKKVFKLSNQKDLMVSSFIRET